MSKFKGKRNDSASQSLTFLRILESKNAECVGVTVGLELNKWLFRGNVLCLEASRVLPLMLHISQQQQWESVLLWPVVHMERALIRGAICTLPGQQKRQGGGHGRYDTLPGLQPRQPAPVTNERGSQGKHGGRRGHGRTGCVCACALFHFCGLLKISCTVSSHPSRPACLCSAYIYEERVCLWL